jgi:ABC-type uncharacterized transport system involved in gliding motility auxiliary subunit
MTKKSNAENYLFSVVGVIAVFVILIAVYVVSHVSATRIDVTAERLNTLSDGTRAILKKLDTPVTIRLYASQGKEVDPQLSAFAQRVADLLNEYRKVGGKNLDIKKLNPEPDTDAEDAANLAGIEGQPILANGDKFYLGISVSMLDGKVALPFLHPNRERLLEYDITRAIANVMTTEKQTVGVMSGLPIFGTPMNPMMMQMQQQQRQEPWVFISELKKDFTVREVPMTAEKIDDDIKLLVVVHPKNASDKLQYALDQFVMRGGKLIAFLDPLSIVESQSMPQQQRFQQAAQGGSNLEKLIKAWGLTFEAGKVVADMEYKTQMGGGRGGQAQVLPAVLTLNGGAINTNDVATSQIDSLMLLFAGSFSGTPAVGLQETVLASSSAESQLIDRFMAEFSGENATKDFVSSGKPQTLGLRLTGKFKTAFPDGGPSDPSNTNAAPAAASLKESAQDTAVILMGDSDLLFDNYAAQVGNFMGQRMVIPFNGNLSLIQNFVEQLSGDNNLITVRSRATQMRPFEEVRKRQAKAEARFRDKIKEMQKSVQDSQTRLNDLQRNKESGQRFIISPEQQKEIDNLRKKQVEVNRELRTVQKDLKKEVNSLENSVKWANILGMPVAVTLTGLILAFLKRKKTAAK